MLEPEPSDLQAHERAQAFTYSPVRSFAQRILGFFQPVIPGSLGLDASAWQVTIDFLVAKAKGILWAYLRALHGLNPDTKFPIHYPNAKGVMPRAAYLYYKDDLDPKAQAQKLYETCLQNGDIGDFMPVLDIEGKNNPTLTASKIKTCCEQIYILFGKGPLIYTGFYVWRDEVTGDKSWAIAYSLIIAGYPFVGWFPGLPQAVLDYPPLIPEPFQMWTADPDENMAGRVVAWQFTSYAPAAEYGVSGNYLDLDWCSPAFQKQVLNQQLPPPDPEPEPIGEPPMLQFKALTTVNIRSSPAVISSPSNDIGNMPQGAIVTAWAMKLFSGGSFWARIEPLPAWLTTTANEYWIALEYKAGNVLVDYTPAAPIAYLIKTSSGNTPLYYWKEKNVSGKPIMVKPTDPPKFLAGKQVIVDPVEVDTDGTENYYRVLNGAMASPPALTPPPPWQGWYCKTSEVF